MIGETVAQFRILEKLGEGGMGVVYKAHDTSLDRTVALKFLSPQATHGEDEKPRFIREARSAAKVEHPNVLPVHAVGKVQDKYFIDML